MLPFGLGQLKGLTNSFATDFLVFGVIAIGAGIVLSQVGRTWEQTFVGRGGKVGAVPAADSLPSASPSVAELPLT